VRAGGAGPFSVSQEADCRRCYITRGASVQRNCQGPGCIRAKQRSSRATRSLRRNKTNVERVATVGFDAGAIGCDRLRTNCKNKDRVEPTKLGHPAAHPETQLNAK